jgi:hypothetical protein
MEWVGRRRIDPLASEPGVSSFRARRIGVGIDFGLCYTVWG